MYICRNIKFTQLNEVALIIIYNHQYNKNIEIIENIYSKRFGHIYHLVPFYKGTKENVIPVYENSYYFQGYVAQGLRGFFKKNYTHYFFIADDLMLNPAINETNYSSFFNLQAKDSFLSYFENLSFDWFATLKAFKWNMRLAGVEVVDFLPSCEEALRILKKYGVSLDVKDTRKNSVKIAKRIKNNIHLYGMKGGLKSILKKPQPQLLPYPFLGGYSDIFIISSDVIEDFAHFCGIFAATELHVETAVPTCLALVTENIVTEKETELKGHLIWGEAIRDFEKSYEGSLKKLLNNFPEKLYIHPIKLSRWQ